MIQENIKQKQFISNFLCGLHIKERREQKYVWKTRTDTNRIYLKKEVSKSTETNHFLRINISHNTTLINSIQN